MESSASQEQATSSNDDYILGARDDYKSNHEETEHESEVGRSKEKKLKFHVLAVREDQKDNSSGTRGKPDDASTILFLAVREEPNPNVSRETERVFLFMHHTRLQGSPSYSAFLEPERELHERTRDFRERLKALCST
ncbi:hypothetical protein L1987_01112 [Smallanthus sonchifolius]|uniref:Uncharacterized protein n=1 Tax=Smallanthus sonchifolius TaxID=185202 RepID=A0ACB9K4C8_9ASTR|nr:hypothetical protein L1987_01112 [Smallanthus sonchifolius]